MCVCVCVCVPVWVVGSRKDSLYRHERDRRGGLKCDETVFCFYLIIVRNKYYKFEVY